MAAAASASQTSKDLSLEGLRGIACFSVFLCHFLFSVFPALAQGFSPDVEIPAKYGWESIASTPFFTVFYNGSFGVAIFFVMSGYVLTGRFFQTGNVRYLQRGAAKRYIRLGIPVFVSVLFGWVLLTSGLTFTQKAPEIGSAGWPMAVYKDPVSFLTALKDGLYGASLFGSTILNSPLWTIQVELLGSIMLFATYAMFATHRMAFNLLFFVVFLMLMFPSSTVQLHCMTLFAGSCLNYIPWNKVKKPMLSAALLGVGLVLGAYDLSNWYDFLRAVPMPTPPAPIVDLAAVDRYVYTAIGAVFVVAAVLSSPLLKAFLSRPFFVWLGRISFALYLLHWPVICCVSFGLMYYLVPLSGWEYGFAALFTFVVTTAVALPLSALFERWVDRPAQSLANVFAAHVLSDKAPTTSSDLIQEPADK